MTRSLRYNEIPLQDGISTRSARASATDSDVPFADQMASLRARQRDEEARREGPQRVAKACHWMLSLFVVMILAIAGYRMFCPIVERARMNRQWAHQDACIRKMEVDPMCLCDMPTTAADNTNITNIVNGTDELAEGHGQCSELPDCLSCEKVWEEHRLQRNTTTSSS